MHLFKGVVIQRKTTLMKYFFREFPDFRPINLLKGTPSGIFLFSEQLVFRSPLDDCFEIVDNN